jgi:O-antigen ligase
VFDLWQQRPITGNGYNYMRPSHNVYLGLLGSAGILGVGGLLMLETTIFRRAWRRRSDLLAACVAAGYASYLTAAYFDNIFWWRWLWFYVGMVVAVMATRPGPSEPGYEGASRASEPAPAPLPG